MSRFLSALVSVAAAVILYWLLCSAVTSPELTARYRAQTQARTAIEQAQQATRRVESEQWGATVRRWAQTAETWGGWAGAAVIAGVGGYVVVQWQRERTRRHALSEAGMTDRLLITAKRDIALAYIEQCGDPGAYRGQLGGMAGVFLPASNEFVPLDVCRAELALAQRPMLTEGREL